MVESLDELLECLESDDEQVSKSTVHRPQLSLDLNDILSMDLDLSPVEAVPTTKAPGQEKVKCCPTLIGGTAAALDVSKSSPNRTCLALHCRDCDFPVNAFPDYEWAGHVEYLFLRTNMPDFGKILPKLSEKNGAVAYACHCVSFSTEKLRPLHETSLPWFCRGHVQSFSRPRAHRQNP